MFLLRTLAAKIQQKLLNRRTRRPLQRFAPRLETLEDRLTPSVDLLVSSFGSNQVLSFDGQTGTPLGPFTSGGGLVSPVGAIFGPDGNLYVAGRDSNDILRYNGTTGAFLNEFVSPGSGGLWGPHTILFGPDGNLYVASGFNGEVLRYNGQNGQFLNAFVLQGLGGLSFPHGMAFGPDGNLYVADRNTGAVHEYNGQSGGFITDFVAPGTAPLATGLVFGPEGNLYVCSFQDNAVLRFNGQTGAFLGDFTSGGDLNGPQGLVFGPDGNLYVSSFNTNAVVEYNGQTGAFIKDFATGGGLVEPTGLVFRDTDTTTTLSASASQITFGQSVTLTATVTAVQPDLGAPTGSVIFTVGDPTQYSVPLQNGQATLTLTNLGAGSHNFTAAYSGDSKFSPSTSSTDFLAVAKADTATTLSSSMSSAVFGQSVTFTATVTAVQAGLDPPTGSVTFTVDGATQYNVALQTGQASLTLSLGAGKHTVTATYDGDDNFNTSVSSPVSLPVAKADTTTALIASLSSAVFGQAVTFTATVTPVPPGAGSPGGTATLFVDGAPQTSAPVSNGQVSFTTTSLSVGLHTVSVIYNGDDNFGGSAPASLSLNVVRAHTSIALTSSANPSLHHQPVTFTATVTAVAPGAGVPEGSVVFVIDWRIIRFVPLVNGVATLSLSDLPVGKHRVFAIYVGSDSYDGSVSPLLIETVDPNRHHRRHRDRG
jgi:hypothetical protein